MQVGLAQVSPHSVDVLHVVETEHCSEEKLVSEATRFLCLFFFGVACVLMCLDLVGCGGMWLDVVEPSFASLYSIVEYE